MPKPAAMKTPELKSWSFTRYADYEKCPLFFQQTHLLKIKEEKNDAMLRGQKIAQASEDYLKGKTKKLAPELKTFEDEYKFYRTQKNLIVEENWGFDRQWNPVKWDDWKNCFLRVKIDIAYVDLKDNELHIRDGKTGKYRPYENAKYMQQLELYSAAGVAMFPRIGTITPRLNYTDLGITYPDGNKSPDVVYTAKEAKALQKDWDKRIVPMFNDRRFAPRPGQYCQWCQFRKSVGGICKY